jgi:hypothetical protein
MARRKFGNEASNNQSNYSKFSHGKVWDYGSYPNRPVVYSVDGTINTVRLLVLRPCDCLMQ